MATVAPTITAENPHQYREQIERVQGFTSRLHIDLMDGIFTKNKSLEISQVWLPDHITCDIHMMFENPLPAVEMLCRLKPSLVIVEAEADYSVGELKAILQSAGVKFGVALLAESKVENFRDKIALADHVLIFSGNLGHQGGSTADLDLLSKVAEIKAINPNAEIGWDGGVNDQNARVLAEGGVDVINAGGYIHHSNDPKNQFKLLEQALA